MPPSAPTTAAPQVALTAGRHRPLPPCAGCAEDIDPEAEHYLCWAGCPARPEILAAAHPGRWGDADDSYDDTCPTALRRFWEKALADVGAAVLRLGTDAGGNRFFAGDVGLHAGTAIEVLTPEGTWQPARFEYDVATWSPLAYVALGGWDAPRRRSPSPPARWCASPPSGGADGGEGRKAHSAGAGHTGPVPATAPTTLGCARLARLPAGNTRPRRDRCSARRVGPERLRRPRSRPAIRVPLRQTASDPCLPVEGGSANDYDYCWGDPVNCADLAGTYGYTKTYDIGPSFGPGSAAQLWQLVKDAPSLAFPFDVSGAIEQGSSLCVRPFAGACENVEVYGVTDTSFSFKVTDGHFLPKGATITFSIRESEGRLIFRVVGRGPDTWTRWFPGFNQIIRPGIESYLWGKMAYNLGGTRSALAQRHN